MKQIVIVAHPDDEILFAYHLLKYKYVEPIHVLSVTNGDHPVRALEFNEIVSSLGHIPEMWSYPDVWGEGFPTSIHQRLYERIQGFEKVFTHNRDGEYGHSQHKALHNSLSALVNQHMYVFGRSDKQLSFDVLSEKITLLKRYKSQYNLKTYDWYDQEDRSNTMMKYVTSETFTQIR